MREIQSCSHLINSPPNCASMSGHYERPHARAVLQSSSRHDLSSGDRFAEPRDKPPLRSWSATTRNPIRDSRSNHPLRTITCRRIMLAGCAAFGDNWASRRGNSPRRSVRLVKPSSINGSLRNDDRRRCCGGPSNASVPQSCRAAPTRAPPKSDETSVWKRVIYRPAR